MTDLSARLREYADIAEAGGKPHWAKAMREAAELLMPKKDEKAHEEWLDKSWLDKWQAK